MKKIKLLFLFLVSLVCILFAGCGAHIDSKITLNSDGSGKRDIICTIQNSDFSKIAGGEAALDGVLNKNKPQILTLKKEKNDTTTTYTYSYDFKSFDDYLSKTSSLTGGSPHSSFDASGGIFSKKYSFKEENLNYKLMKWAIDAVINSNITYAGTDNLYELGNTTVTMGDKSDVFKSNIDFNYSRLYSTDKINIFTKMNSSTSFSRDITYYFTAETYNLLNQNSSELDNFMKGLIPSGGKLEKVSGPGGLKGYKISFSAQNIQELNSKTSAATKDKSPVFADAVLNNTSFFESKQQISDKISFRDYASGSAIDKGISYSFEAPSGYTYETLMGNNIPENSDGSFKAKDGSELTDSNISTVNFNNDSQGINFTAAFHTTNYLSFIILAAVILLVVVSVTAIFLIVFKKIRALDAAYAEDTEDIEPIFDIVQDIPKTASEKTITITLKEEPASSIFCTECGARNAIGSSFCRKCGVPLTEANSIRNGHTRIIHKFTRRIKNILSEKGRPS